ncbi:glycosyltransferase [Acetobacter sp. AN02]|nr:glycosyltransferase [Acetobacter sp. AN02]
MRARPELRLVLFREKANRQPILLMDEFPELALVQNQIEWRDVVQLPDLPDEFAHFDISIAPLESDNVFCEAKSEIKYMEAALAGVPSVVSPTAPYRAAIENGVTGFLAQSEAEWEDALTRLLDDPDLRARMARNAYHDVLWRFGPWRQARTFGTVIAGLGGGEEATRAAELQLLRAAHPLRPLPVIPDSETLFHHDALGEAEVTILITCYNYAEHITEALDSARAQTLEQLDLIVVDDGSSDDSVALILSWAKHHASRFNRLLVLRSVTNAGLGGARNIGVSASRTPYFLSLDADNRLLPDACTALLSAAGPMTAYVWPLLRQFGPGGHHAVMGDAPEQPLRLQDGNYIDAMALVAVWAWAACGGYYVSRDAMGWEDYDLWAGCTELGLHGAHLPEIVAEYRVHGSSMTNSVTEKIRHKARVVDHILARHPWLDVHPEASARS